MKRSALIFLGLVVGVGITGCSSPPSVDSDKTMFDYMQEEAAKVAEDGGMAAVGMARSRTIDLAIARAKADARKNLGQQVQVKIENLEKSFVEEIGEAETSEINQMFSSATKQVTSQTLSGTRPALQKYETDDGITTAYVLMTLNPEVVDASLRNNSAKHLYERFRASKAFEELDKEIREFDEAERQSVSGM